MDGADAAEKKRVISEQRSRILRSLEEKNSPAVAGAESKPASTTTNSQSSNFGDLDLEIMEHQAIQGSVKWLESSDVKEKEKGEGKKNGNIEDCAMELEQGV